MISVLPPLTRLKGMALDLFFPRWCVGCGVEGSLLCKSCQRSLPWIAPPLCPRCGNPQPLGAMCSSCTAGSMVIDGIRAPFRFDGVVRQAVHELKYRGVRALAAPLSGLMADYLTESPVPGEVLVPVPLHRRRLRERGYNQSALLARELGRIVGMPVVTDCLRRQRHGQPQARTSSVDERRLNVTGVFGCRDGQIRGRQVVLVDDVTTSGATLDACAACLKASGAVSVWGLALAREV